MRIINATLYPMDGAVIENGYLTLKDGKIEALGSMDQAPDGDQTLDAEGGYVLPGLVDIHSHLGLFGDSLTFEGEDGNEDTDPCTPHLRAVDGINPFDRGFSEALAAGVTTVLTGPGSANPIAGQICAMKTYGNWVDDMVIQAPCAMKFALGENPKGTYNQRHETPVTRMATAAILRENLAKVQEYLRKQEEAAQDEELDPPDLDVKLEALLPLLRGEIPAHFHAHRADDIATALRVAQEFSLRAVLIHGTEGHLVAQKLAQRKIPVVCGPIMTDRSKPELSNQTVENPARLAAAGVKVAICTDHPEVPEPYLMLSAALCVRAGMEEAQALRAVTLTAAEIAGIDRRVGSLTPGKDGDVVVFDRHPLEVAARVKAVFVDGRRVI